MNSETTQPAPNTSSSLPRRNLSKQILPIVP